MAAQPFGLLDGLLARELQLHVLSFLEDPHDIAALLLALPPLGLDVMRTYPDAYTQEPLLSVALALHRNEDVLSVALLRRYVCDRRVTSKGCEWLSRAVAAAGRSYSIVIHHFYGYHGQPSGHTYNVSTYLRAAAVRSDYKNGTKIFFEGEKGAERKVRIEHANGFKRFFEGKKGREREVRAESPSGNKQFYEGEKGAERKVRVEYANGLKVFFEGEKGQERVVRS